MNSKQKQRKLVVTFEWVIFFFDGFPGVLSGSLVELPNFYEMTPNSCTAVLVQKGGEKL